MEKKICKICGLEKNIELFALGRKSKIDNKQLYKCLCKKCDNRKQWEKKKVSEKYRSKISLKNKIKYQENIVEMRLRNKIYRLKSLYNLTQEQFEQMKVNQNHKCYICKKVKKLVIDHCHKSGKIRALLCNHCNTSLGGFQEDRSILMNAIRYLDEYKKDC